MLYREKSGERSPAQIKAFEDTWEWDEAAALAKAELVESENKQLSDLIEGLYKFLGRSDMMAYLSMMGVRLVELKRVLKPDGTIYLHCDPTASHYLKLLMDAVFSAKHFRNEIVWCYRGGGVPKKDFANKHDVVFRYSKTNDYYFNVDPVRTPYSQDSADRLKYKARSFRESGTYDDYEPHPEGKHPEDWWTIQPIMPSSKERIGYPTQKPEKLLERIILSSSEQGDVVLDPFCGCGTTLAVAERYHRHWIGIDVTHLAISLMRHRLRDTFEDELSDYELGGAMPQDVESARALAENEEDGRSKFEEWAVGLVDGFPHKLHGPDAGIDGFIKFYVDEEGESELLLIQVKSGKVKREDIGNLWGAMEREGAQIGAFITLNPPTPKMNGEAASAGTYKPEHFDKEYRRIQILTVEGLLNGTQELKYPNMGKATFKRARRKGKDRSDKERGLDLN